MGEMKIRRAWIVLGLLVSAMSAHALDFSEVLGVRIGDRLSDLGSKVAGLEPDVCATDERGWYQANGWSCEGYARGGVRAGSVELKARFRMVEPMFSVGNVTLTGEVFGQNAEAQAEALMSGCIDLKRELDGRFGKGSLSNISSKVGGLKFVVHYDMTEPAESVTLLCRQDESTGKAEMLVSIERLRGANQTRTATGFKS